MPIYCTQCGHTISATDLRCEGCGAPRFEKKSDAPEIAPSLPPARPIAGEPSSAGDPHLGLFARERWLLPTLGAILAGALVAFALISNAAGQLIERRYESALQTLSAYDPNIELTSYNRGWFSARAEVELKTRSVPIRLVQQIHYVSMPFESVVPAAAIDTEIQLPKTDMRALRQEFGNVSPKILTLISLDGAMDTRLSVPAFTHHAASGSWAVSQIDVDCYLTNNEQVLFVHTPSAVAALPGHVERASLKGLMIKAEIYRAAHGIHLGSVNAGLRSLDWQYYDPRSGSQVSAGYVRHFLLTFSSSLRDNLMDLVGNLSFASSEFPSGNVHAELNAVDVAALNRFIEQTRSLAAGYGIADLRDVLRAQSQSLRILAAKRPHLSVEFRLSGAGGTADGTIDLHVDGDLNGHYPPGDAENPSILMRLLMVRYTTASASIRVPEPMADNLLGEQDVREWIRNGWAALEGSQLVSNIKYREGHLFFNGKRFPHAVR